ncbi:Sugar/inositol transporter [Corchorus olitorius]|uniref:Sugar/inositol transporter n=1 Tax=Corchorus olitorius TaxID=93759 RepID=A0A1R3IP56_9ROSI|nr:Sugar/inositol transporter [Corchorus olitorius]
MGGSGENQSTMNRYALACSIVASVITIIFGYDTGVMSGAMVFIEEELKINDGQVEVLAGILNICALFGSLIAGRTSDYIGRRYTIVLASIIFLVGSVLMGYGPNYGILLAGRCTAGIGVGFALTVAPVYSSEIASAKTRGFLASLPELGISIGVLLGYVSNYFFGKLTLKLGWRLMLGVAAIPSLGLAFGILKMPESPRWLILQGRLREAREVLSDVCNTQEEADSRFRDITAAAGIDGKAINEDVVGPPSNKEEEAVWKQLLIRPTPTVRWILIVAVGIHFFEHATGIEAVILYGPRIFKKAGVQSKSKRLLATIGIGLTKFTFIFISTFIMDKVGRRRLLLLSVAGMVIALAGLGFGLTVVEHAKEKLTWALVLCLVFTYLYVAIFNSGLAPVTWVYSAEIFPLKLRAQGYSIGVAVNRLMNAVISMSFISIYKAITIGGTFFMFAGISVVAWWFFYFLAPETKGKSLEEIEALFTRSARAKDEGVEIQPGNSV